MRSSRLKEEVMYPCPYPWYRMTDSRLNRWFVFRRGSTVFLYVFPTAPQELAACKTSYEMYIVGDVSVVPAGSQRGSSSLQIFVACSPSMETVRALGSLRAEGVKVAVSVPFSTREAVDGGQ